MLNILYIYVKNVLILIAHKKIILGELKHTLSISRPVIIFCSHFSIHNIEETTLELPFVKELILFNNNSDAESKFTTYESLINLHKNSKPLTVENINPTESVAFLLCSSGTTGLPKCVELTHANYMNLLNFVRSVNFFNFQLYAKKAEVILN